MRSVVLIGQFVFVDGLRRRMLYVVLLFAAIMAALIPSLPSYGLGVESAVFREFALAVIYVTALVIGLALAANRVPGEVERRTAYNVLVKSVSRSAYLCGTWLGITLLVGAAIGVCTAIVQVIAAFSFSEPMWVLWQGAFAIWLESGVVTALAVAVSAVAGPVVVVVASLAGIFIGHARGTLLGEEGAVVASRFYPSLDSFAIINPVAHGTGVGVLHLASMLVVFIGFVGVFLGAGCLLFERRDL